MKEEDLSTIKRYPIVEYLERKGIKPVRRIPAYELYRSPFREEIHPSFKVDTQKNLWIDYAEGRGGRIIDLSVCDWRTARCRKPSAVWDKLLHTMKRTTFQGINPVLVPIRMLQSKQTEQGD